MTSQPVAYCSSSSSNIFKHTPGFGLAGAAAFSSASCGLTPSPNMAQQLNFGAFLLYRTPYSVPDQLQQEASFRSAGDGGAQAGQDRSRLAYLMCILFG